MDWNIGTVYLVAIGFHSIMIAIATYVLLFLRYDGDDDGDDDDDDGDDDDNDNAPSWSPLHPTFSFFLSMIMMIMLIDDSW